MSLDTVYTLTVIHEGQAAPPSVFASREAAFNAGAAEIETFRDNSRLADEIDEVLADWRHGFSKTRTTEDGFGAGDGSCTFWVWLSAPTTIEG
jgi:hypothetical protein